MLETRRMIAVETKVKNKLKVLAAKRNISIGKFVEIILDSFLKKSKMSTKREQVTG